MVKLFRIFRIQKKLLLQHRQQTREIKQLRAALAKLRTQNNSMRDGLRRCVSCDYRIDFKQKQANANDTTNYNSYSKSNIHSNIHSNIIHSE
jgi:uncharacterized protein with PIN domain